MARPGHPDTRGLAANPHLSEISCLRAEIYALQDETRKQLARLSLVREWKKFLEREVTHTHGTADIAQNLPDEIEILQNITGISISNVNTEIKEQGDLMVVRRMHVEGCCGVLDFVVDMDIHQQMNTDYSVETKLSNVSILTSEEMFADLGQTIDTLTKDCNLQGYFMIFQSYSEWHSARRKTFTYFTDTYPDIATQPGPDILQLRHPTKNCIFEVVWTFHSSDMCSVVPAFELLLTVPEKVKDINDVLKRTPDTFQLMLKELGIEKALHTLIQLMVE